MKQVLLSIENTETHGETIHLQTPGDPVSNEDLMNFIEVLVTAIEQTVPELSRHAIVADVVGFLLDGEADVIEGKVTDGVTGEVTSV